MKKGRRDITRKKSMKANTERKVVTKRNIMMIPGK